MCELSVFIRNKEQLEAIKQYTINHIYTDNLELVKESENLIFEVPKNYQEPLPKNILIKDLGMLEEKKEHKNIYIDYGMNIANQSTMELLKDYGVKKMTLSLELPIEELKFFQNLKDEPIEILIYGTIVVMTLKEHPLIKENGYIIEDVKKRKYKTKVLKDNSVIIYHHEPINHINKIKEYKKLGIKNFRFDFLEEGKEEIQNILNEACQNFTLE